MYPREYIMYSTYSHAAILVNSYERVLLQVRGNRRLSDVLTRIADGMTE